MELWCSVYLTLIFITVSVRSNCIVINCREDLVSVGNNCCKLETVIRDRSRCCDPGLIAVRNRCRRKVRRSVESDGCLGSNKIYIDDNILNTPGPLSKRCDDGYVYNENMKCRMERPEPGSGPWETHHYIVRGRSVVIEMRISYSSIKYRSLDIDNNRK